MFASTLALVPLALAATSLALPTLPLPRSSPGPWCDQLGGGAFDIAYNFTLAAYNATLPNTNSTGVPLVLGQNGATTGAEFKVLSTYASYPYNDFPNFSLLHGGLIPNSPDVGAVDTSVTAGVAPGFIVTNLDLPQPAQIYCGVADTDPYGGGTGFPQLAVNGDTDSFSLCLTGDYALAQNNIVYKPASNGSYLYDSCYPVKIQIIGLY